MWIDFRSLAWTIYLSLVILGPHMCFYMEGLVNKQTNKQKTKQTKTNKQTNNKPYVYFSPVSYKLLSSFKFSKKWLKILLKSLS